MALPMDGAESTQVTWSVLQCWYSPVSELLTNRVP